MVDVLVLLAAALLLPAGLGKLRHPEVARHALGLTRRGAEGLVRTIGVGELSLAAAVLLVGGPGPAAALAVTYVAFTVVAVRQRARGASCGCFGASTAPVSSGHVVVNVVAAGAATVAAATAARPVTVLASDSPLAGLPLLLAGTVAVLAVQLSLTALPDLLAAARRSTTGGDA